MRTSKKILNVVILLAMLGVFLTATAFSFTPYGSKSQLIWDEFRKQEQIDTVAIGSSLMARAYDPEAIDAEFGTNSFNLSTPGQQIPESYLGLKEAIEHHDIERVFYGVDFATFQSYSELYPGRVFLNEKWKGDPFFDRFGDLSYALDNADWMFNEKSINWMFPWTEQHVKDNFKGLLKNIRMQVDGTSLKDAAEVNEPGWSYRTKGYGNYSSVVNYNAGKPTVFADKYKPRALDEDSLRRLDELITLCNDNNIEFIAMVPPMPDYSLISLKKVYENNSLELKAFVEERGGKYYDLNLAKPEIFQSRENYYADYQHCNFDGASASSVALGKLIEASEAGQNVDDLFLTLDERLDNMDYISLVRFKDSYADGGVKLTATSYAGNKVEVEYRFLEVDPDTKEQTVLRDYDTEPTFVYTPEESGRHLIRLEARKVGDNAIFSRYSEHSIWF